MQSQGLTEVEAYQLLRSQAMLKREGIEVLAGSIVKAAATLKF